ncbi:MAG TPA: type II secretion system protein [Opitutaceae bacterium]|nr:type II secretion system protein [Opitutaceae bacterium]
MPPHLPPDSPRRPGFTLIEILAVLAVIAAIVAIGVPAISRVLQSARLRNAEGSASTVKSAIAAYLSRPGSLGTIPVTESALTAAPVLPASEWTGTAALNTAAAAKAATLDNLLLAEGLLERPLSIRIGAQNLAPAPTAVALAWSPASESFTNTTAPTADYSASSRAECALCDGSSNPGTTGAAAGSASCAFNLAGTGPLQAGAHVAYLVLKAVPDSDAYQLALDVNGAPLTVNTAAAPAAADQAVGTVEYAKDAGAGAVDVFYYLASL